MPDRFDDGRQALDQLTPTTDLWAEATRRASHGSPAGGVDDSEPGRRFLIAAAVVSVALVGVGALIAQRDDDPMRRPSGAAFPSLLAVPSAGEARPEQLSDSTPVWIVHHPDRTVTVVDAVSAHKPFGIGQLVGWCASSRSYVDPQNGSLYDSRGRKRAGPAPTGLGVFPVGPIEDGMVAVTGPAVRSVEHRTSRAGRPGRGSDCLEADTESGEGGDHQPRTLALHRLAEEPGVPFTQALDRPAGELVVIRDAAILLVPGRTTVVCSGPVFDSNPPACDGVEAPGLELGDGMGSMTVRGTFAARIINHAVDAIVFTTGWTTTSGDAMSPDPDAPDH